MSWYQYPCYGCWYFYPYYNYCIPNCELYYSYLPPSHYFPTSVCCMEMRPFAQNPSNMIFPLYCDSFDYTWQNFQDCADCFTEKCQGCTNWLAEQYQKYGDYFAEKYDDMENTDKKFIISDINKCSCCSDCFAGKCQDCPYCFAGKYKDGPDCFACCDMENEPRNDGTEEEKDLKSYDHSRIKKFIISDINRCSDCSDYFAEKCHEGADNFTCYEMENEPQNKEKDLKSYDDSRIKKFIISDINKCSDCTDSFACYDMENEPGNDGQEEETDLKSYDNSRIKKFIISDINRCSDCSDYFAGKCQDCTDSFAGKYKDGADCFAWYDMKNEPGNDRKEEENDLKSYDQSRIKKFIISDINRCSDCSDYFAGKCPDCTDSFAGKYKDGPDCFACCDMENEPGNDGKEEEKDLKSYDHNRNKKFIISDINKCSGCSDYFAGKCSDCTDSFAGKYKDGANCFAYSDMKNEPGNDGKGEENDLKSYDHSRIKKFIISDINRCSDCSDYFAGKCQDCTDSFAGKYKDGPDCFACCDMENEPGNDAKEEEKDLKSYDHSRNKKFIISDINKCSGCSDYFAGKYSDCTDSFAEKYKDVPNCFACCDMEYEPGNDGKVEEKDLKLYDHSRNKKFIISDINKCSGSSDYFVGKCSDCTDSFAGKYKDDADCFACCDIENEPENEEKVEEKDLKSYDHSRFKKFIISDINKCSDCSDYFAGKCSDCTDSFAGKYKDDADCFACCDIENEPENEEKEEEKDLKSFDHSRFKKFIISDINKCSDCSDYFAGKCPDCTDRFAGKYEDGPDCFAYCDMENEPGNDRKEEEKDLKSYDHSRNKNFIISDINKCSDCSDYFAENCPDCTDCFAGKRKDGADGFACCDMENEPGNEGNEEEKDRKSYDHSRIKKCIISDINKCSGCSDFFAAKCPDCTDCFPGKRKDGADGFACCDMENEPENEAHEEEKDLKSYDHSRNKNFIISDINKCSDCSDYFAENCPDCTDCFAGKRKDGADGFACCDMENEPENEAHEEEKDLKSYDHSRIKKFIISDINKCSDCSDYFPGKCPDCTDCFVGKYKDGPDCFAYCNMENEPGNDGKEEEKDLKSYDHSRFKKFVISDINKCSGCSDYFAGKCPDCTECFAGKCKHDADCFAWYDMENEPENEGKKEEKELKSYDHSRIKKFIISGIIKCPGCTDCFEGKVKDGADCFACYDMQNEPGNSGKEDEKDQKSYDHSGFKKFMFSNINKCPDCTNGFAGKCQDCPDYLACWDMANDQENEDEESIIKCPGCTDCFEGKVKDGADCFACYDMENEPGNSGKEEEKDQKSYDHSGFKKFMFSNINKCPGCTDGFARKCQDCPDYLACWDMANDQENEDEESIIKCPGCTDCFEGKVKDGADCFACYDMENEPGNYGKEEEKDQKSYDHRGFKKLMFSNLNKSPDCTDGFAGKCQDCPDYLACWDMANDQENEDEESIIKCPGCTDCFEVKVKDGVDCFACYDMENEPGTSGKEEKKDQRSYDHSGFKKFSNINKCPDCTDGFAGKCQVCADYLACWDMANDKENKDEEDIIKCPGCTDDFAGKCQGCADYLACWVTANDQENGDKEGMNTDCFEGKVKDGADCFACYDMENEPGNYGKEEEKDQKSYDHSGFKKLMFSNLNKCPDCTDGFAGKRQGCADYFACWDMANDKENEDGIIKCQGCTDSFAEKCKHGVDYFTCYEMKNEQNEQENEDEKTKKDLKSYDHSRFKKFIILDINKCPGCIDCFAGKSQGCADWFTCYEMENEQENEDEKKKKDLKSYDHSRI